MPESFEKIIQPKQSEKKDDAGDFTKNPARNSWLEMMQRSKESLQKLVEGKKRPWKKEAMQAILAAMVLFGNGSFVDAMTSGRPGARDTFWDNMTKQTYEMSQEDIKQRIEAYFGVNLISPSQMSEVIFYQDKKFPVVEWDKEKLMVIMRTLNELPPYFYSPIYIPEASTSESLKVNFIITENIPFAGWCSCYMAKEVAPQIVFSKHLAENEFKTVVVHELMHRFTLINELHYQQKLFDTLEVGSDRELRNMLTSKESDIHGLLESALMSIKERGQLVESDERWIASAKLKLSHGSKNNAEFMAIAGEFYVLGKESFLDIYKYLSESKAEKLYKFIKDDIFFGKEYYNE